MLLAFVIGIMFCISLASAGVLHNSTFMSPTLNFSTTQTDTFYLDGNGSNILSKGGSGGIIWDINGNNLSTFSLLTGNGGLCNNGTNYFEVHDWGGNHQVNIFSWNFTYLSNFSLNASNTEAQGILCYENKVYVGDYADDCVYGYYMNGTYINNYSIFQDTPTGMAVKDDMFYLTNGSTISEFNSSWSLKDTYNSALSSMRGIAWIESENKWAVINYTAGVNQKIYLFPEVATLNLTFSENQTGEIDYTGGSISFTNKDVLFYSMFSFAEGYVYVLFNNQTQMFSFYNDDETFVSEYLYVQSPDLNQQVKVLDGSAEVSNARVTFEKWDEGSLGIVYSIFTDINGLAQVLLKDTQMYKVTVEKEGYEDYVALKYIPPSNAETIIITLIPSGDGVSDDMIHTSCLNIIGTNQTCNFTVWTSTSGNTVGYNYTWAGGNYYVEKTTNSPVTLSLLGTNATCPINVTIYIDGVERKTFTVEYEGLGERSIQLNFDIDEIKDEPDLLFLFYLIAILIGVIFMVSINRIPKAQGFGIYGFAGWFVILAVIGFPIFWFIVVPVLLYLIFRNLWGDGK